MPSAPLNSKPPGLTSVSPRPARIVSLVTWRRLRNPKAPMRRPLEIRLPGDQETSQILSGSQTSVNVRTRLRSHRRLHAQDLRGQAPLRPETNSTRQSESTILLASQK